MIEIAVEDADLAGVRLGPNPLVEVALSLRVLADAERHTIHRPWAREVGPRVADLDLAPLFALVGRRGYIADFLTQPPDGGGMDLSGALTALQGADPAVVRRESEKAARLRPDAGPALEPLHSTGSRGVAWLADLVGEYWRRALAPFWPDIGSVLEGEVLHRARRLAAQGPECTLATLHVDVRVGDGRLRVDKAHRQRVRLDGRGLRLVPSVFAWPEVYAVTDAPWQPSLWYPARGAGRLWESGDRDAATASAPALERLVGASRARLLESLGVPATTLGLARRLDLAPSTVSEQLTRLAGTGLLARVRSGRSVYYALTPAGRRLLDALGGRT